MDAFRRFQKRVNPLVVPFAGRIRPYGVLQHVGRRSGRRYVTPVVAFALGNDLVIPLPFSAGVDWCRNTLAAGGCTLRRGGKILTLGSPEVVDRATALPALTALARIGVRLIGTRQFLRLRRLDA